MYSSACFLKQGFALIGGVFLLWTGSYARASYPAIVYIVNVIRCVQPVNLVNLVS